MRKLLLVVICAAAGGAASAQAPEQAPIEQGPTFRTGVELITVDVSVVDSRGRPVEDLRAPEFSVQINGEPRRVVTAELVRFDVEAARKQAADRAETFFTTNITPVNGRQIVIAVDQIHISPASIRPVMSAAARFLDRLTPLDQVAFIAFPEPGPRVNFTSDRTRLKLAMEGLVGQFAHEMRTSDYNIGISEALELNDKRDQIVLAAVMNRECRARDPQARAQCERDILTESASIAQRVRTNAQRSLRGLQTILEQLALIDGPKSLILISESLAIDSSSDLDGIVRLAGRARTAINVLVIDQTRNDIQISELPPTGTADRRIHVEGLEALAMMSRGALFQVVGSGELIFDRLASEISAHYILGVEQRPGDEQGGRRRIDVEVRRRGVTIRSRQAFVVSPAIPSRRSHEDILRDALGSPFAVPGVPLRVTTFAQQDPKSEKVRLTVAAQVGQPGTPPGEYTVGYLLVDDQNRIAASFGGRQRLAPGAGSPSEALEYIGGALVDPGIYSLRFAVVDPEGRRGSVIRDVNAWKMTGEELAMSDLVVGNTPPGGQGLRPSVEPHVNSDALAAYLELYASAPSAFDRMDVRFEVAADEGGPALLSVPAQLAPGAQPSWRVATGVIGARPLPPGRYVARATIAREGRPTGSLVRPFVIERSAAPGVPAPEAVSTAAAAFARTLPAFDRGAVLRADVVASMLDLVERRSPALKEALAEARAGRYGPAALEALAAGDQETAAFLRGLELFTKGQLDQAATQLSLASGPRRQFFPAAFYLGAIYAAAGRDRDAAGVWQIAIGSEPRPISVYIMAADARLRDGQPASAIDLLKPAYALDPANDDVARRLGMAYVLTGQYADAVPVLDAYLARHPADQDLLLAAVLAHYEAAQAGRTPSNADRERLRRYASAYRGSHAALVAKYVEILQVR